MHRREERTICFLLVLVATVSASPTPEFSYSGKPKDGSQKDFQRSLASPTSSFNTITVPYSPKPSMFPKFVDPKAMIAKKTDMLTNMFPEDPTLDKNSLPQKRSLFGPFSPFSPFSPFGPYAFGPYAGGPYSAFTPSYYQSAPSSYNAGSSSYSPETSNRRRRSLEPAPKMMGPPPSYPSLSPIPEEPEESKALMPRKAGTPIEYLPPFGPMFGPMVDPSMFIAKKTVFLDNLFKTLATSTPAPLGADDTPTTKATIVPPNFWLPSSITPDPLEYNNKVASFLDKLFDSLKLNKTTPSADVPKYNFVRSVDSDSSTQKKVARSLDDVAAISAAKDSIVDSILSELIDLKGDMVTTLDDLMAFQKVSSPSKKPAKPGFGPWAKFGTVDPSLPFKQRMTTIAQVFDMLTDLQRNITNAVQEAVSSKLDAKPFYEVAPPGSNINMTLLDAIKTRLTNLGPYKSPDFGFPYGAKFSRSVPQTATSFWVSYPQEGPGTVKRQVEEDISGKLVNEINAEKEKSGEKKKGTRSVDSEGQQYHFGPQEMFQYGPGKNFPYQRLEDPSYWEQYHGHRHHHNHH